MNLTALLSLISGILVAVLGMVLTAKERGAGLFWDEISIFIVVGGTIAATSISVRVPKMWTLFKIFMNKVIRGRSVDFKKVIIELIKVNNEFSRTKNFEQAINNVQDPFLKECLQLHIDDLVDDHQFIKMLKDRVRNMHKFLMIDINRFKNIGKYPPAFGMMGTTIGMVVLLDSLGGKDAMSRMGPAMATCLITTLYGVIMANIFVVPISENIDDCAQEINLKNKIIVEGLHLVLLKTPPAIIAEELNSHLELNNRVDWKEVTSA